MAPLKLAIIDIGSKTVRLSIYEETHLYEMEEIKKEKVSLRLSQHVLNGSLSQEGIEQLINVLKDFEKTIHACKVEKVECIATAAIRNAENQNEILTAVKEQTPFTIRLLSGELEAQYGLLAISQSLAISDGIAIDLGGGSTEITLFRNQEMVETISIPFGVVTLAKRFCDGLPPSEDALNRLRAYVKNKITSLDWIKSLNLPIIGIGGSVRLIGKYSMSKKQSAQDLNGYSILKAEVLNIAEQMKNMTADELSRWAKDNADLAMPALVVLSELMLWTGSKEIICCTKGIKDGLIFSKMND